MAEPAPSDYPQLLKWLRFPAYSLYHVSTLEESARGEFLYDIVPTFFTRFTPAQQQGMIEALRWVAVAPEVDWERVLPSLSSSDDFRRAHLRITLERIEAMRKREQTLDTRR
jgi:hypothetical protein